MSLLRLKRYLAATMLVQIMLGSTALPSVPAAIQQGTANDAAIEEQQKAAEYDQTIQPMEWRLPISIETYNRLGLRAHAQRALTKQLPEPFYLISIDGQDLRSKTPADIFRAMRGRVGQTAQVVVLTEDGNYKEYQLPYDRSNQESYSDYRLLMLPGLLSSFDGSSGINWDTPDRLAGQSLGWAHLDLLSTASALQALELSIDIPGSTDASVNSAAIQAASQLLVTGEVGKADTILRKLQQLPVLDKNIKRRLDSRYPDLFAALNILNMPEEAIKIGSPVIEADRNKMFAYKMDPSFETREIRVPMYMAYAKSLNLTNDGERQELTETLAKILEKEPLNDGNANIALANIYARAGLYEKAEKLYATETSEWEKRAAEIPPNETRPPKMQLATVIYLTSMLKGLAVIELKHGDKPSAIAHLTRAKELYATEFTVDQLTKIKEIPQLSAGLGSIESLLTNATKNIPVENLDLYVELTDYLGDPPNQKRFASAYMAFRKALEGKNRDEIGQKAKELTADFDERESAIRTARPSLDQYSVMLIVSRRLADKKYWPEAAAVLDHLQQSAVGNESTAVPAFFLNVEKAVNKELAGDHRGEDWQKLWQVCEPGKISQLELMRALACLYIAADEPIRARAIIDATQRLCTLKQGNTKYATFTSILLDLDRAQLDCKAGKFDQALQLFNNSTSQFDRLKIQAPSRGLTDLNKRFLTSTFLLARAFHQCGQNEKSKQLLLSVINRLQSKSSWLGVARKNEYASIEPVEAGICAYLGKLLIDERKYDSALPYLTRAIDYSGESVPKCFYLLRAQCAVAQNDNITAYIDFSKYAAAYASEDSTDTLAVQPGWKEIYCRKAIYYAQLAKAKPAELARLYADLATVLDETGKKEEKLTALQSAYSYMEDNTQEKINRAQEIAQLIDQIGPARTDTSASAQSDQALKMREAAATLAQESGKFGAWNQWLELARNEVNVKNYDAAIAHYQMALKSVDKDHPYFLTSVGLSADFSYPLNELAASGKSAEVENIWTTMVAKAATITDEKSFEYTNLLAHVFAFYATTKQSAKALATLDQILAVNPMKQELGLTQVADNSARQLLRKTAYELAAKNGQLEFAQIVAEKLVAAQRQTYGNDDLRLCSALTTLAQIELLRSNLADAEKHAREALAIARLYRLDFEPWGPDGLDTSCAQVLEDVLTKESKTDEIKTLQADLKMRQETRQNYSDPTMDQESYQRSSYEWWLKNGLYNYSFVSASTPLLEKAVIRNDWVRVQELAPQFITALAHNSQCGHASCSPPPSPEYLRFFAFEAMVKACMQSGHKDQAEKWLNRAVAEMSYRPRAEEYAFLATIENECGNKSEALEYGHKAEQASTALPSSLGKWQIRALYEKLGATAETERLEASIKADTISQGDEAYRNYKISEEGKGPAKIAHKLPPVDDARLAAKLQELDPSDEYMCIEPCQPMTFRQVTTVTDKYLFNYAAVGMEGLMLNSGDAVIRSAADTYSIAGGFSSMSGAQIMHKAGNFLFLYDGGAENPLTTPPPAMAKLLPALSAPATATAISPQLKNISLAAGDYSGESVRLTSLAIAKGGRVRIFIHDSAAPADGNAFECSTEGKINVAESKKIPTGSGHLEIWYNGKAPIKLGKQSHFNGLIYAPNTEIHLDRGVVFCGAMAAKKVTAAGDCKIMYDPRYRQSGND